jgi:hypothetical protein
MDAYLGVFVAVMFLAGLLGGAINHYLSQESESPESPTQNSPSTRTTRAFMGRELLVGLGASFMVPLFLNMVSSNLIEQIKGAEGSPAQPYKLLVFAGFCLVAAISSRAFIRTISDRILNEVKQAKREVQEAKKEVQEVKEDVQEVHADFEPILSQQTEDEVSVGRAAQPAPEDKIGEIEQRVLRAFSNSRFALRTIGGVASETSIGIPELEGILSELSARGMVGQRMGKKGMRWYITQKGLNAIQGI